MKGMAEQSTTSRANHQAQARKAPQALPCPPRHEVYNADPCLFAMRVESLCGGRRNPTDSWLLRDIASMNSLDILSSYARDMWLSAFVAVMFTRR
jgi:hypothetical protein